MPELSKRYNPKETEKAIYRLWEKSGFFNPDKLPGKRSKTFAIVLPPPNITGSLHMGHALNATVQDILIRWKRLSGFKTLWLPGTDHAGIATQNVVEKELRKEGLSRFDLGREKFVKRVWQWRKKYGNIILDQFKKLGSSLDWSRTKFTLDKDYSSAVLHAFSYYYKKGWIYRGKRVINWCPRCQTSLSDLEVNHKEQKGKLWYIKYPLIHSSQFIVIATTRPETMLGDTAVAVNPKDQRYKNLVGKKVVLPLVKRQIPIIADKLADPKFGTGALKVTPGHSIVDYEISLRHRLPIIEVINKEAKMNENAPKKYQNLSILQAREKIVQDLEKAGLLEKVQDYQISSPKCDRCKTTIEQLPSEQWFLKMEKLAQLAKKAVKSKRVKFYPKNFEKIYFDWLDNIRDWCISRQLWWGHRLPVWYCQNSKNKFFISLKKPAKCLICKKCKPKQSKDVLDTWFSSALWPFATLGWPKKTKDLKTFYPTNFLATARDIINLWVARMIFSGKEFLKKEPFKDVFIHPTILTKQGKRMSKSLGTGIDPLELIEKYGADATRFGIAWQLLGSQDIRFSEDHIIMGKKFANKIWNASRFIFFQVKESKISLGSFPKNKKGLAPWDKKILKELEKTEKLVNKYLASYQFGRAARQLYNFFWGSFCDIYIEKSKDQLRENSPEQTKIRTQKVLLYILSRSLILLHPFMPFVTEKIYQSLPLKGKKKFLIIESWPK